MEENIYVFKNEMIKARVTPHAKMKIIQQAAKLGLDQSGFLTYAIQRLEDDNEEGKQKDETIKRLQQEMERYKTELAGIHRALRPIRNAALREPLEFEGKKYNVKSDLELVEFLASIFKLTPESDEN